MVDISFNNAKRMLKLKKMFGPKFVWCDHHKPIIDESFRLGFDDVNGIRDTSKSAILCVYQYLFDPFNEKYNDQLSDDEKKAIKELFENTNNRKGKVILKFGIRVVTLQCRSKRKRTRANHEREKSHRALG